MAARVLCFGRNDCNRSLVLREVGYDVDLCPTLIEFRAVIRERADANAVLVTEERPSTARAEVVMLTREHSQARLVLFKNNYHEDEAGFDLVIPPLVPPDQWLRDIADVIDRSQVLNATARAIREQSALLRKDSEDARLQSMIERERTEGIIRRILRKSDPSSKD